MSRHEAVMEWLASCPLLQQLYFQFGAEVVDSVIVSPSTQTLHRFIDGSRECRYVCELVWTLPASSDADEINIDAMLYIDALNEWLDEQNSSGNYPAFPDNCRISEIEPIDSGTGYVASEDGLQARYIVPFAFIYDEEVG